MTFHFYSPRALEPWDWRNPDEKGIGNSETSHIEMALRLAKRGHWVTSYTRLPDDDYAQSRRHIPGVVGHRGVWWRDLKDANFSRPGVWLLYRCPEVIDEFEFSGSDTQVWLIVQDTYFRLTASQAAIVDRVICLCQGQAAEQRKQSPNCADKVCVSSNGIRVDMIEDVEHAIHRCRFCRDACTCIRPNADDCDGCPECMKLGRERFALPPVTIDRYAPLRNPHRIHFSSSPDRGLRVLVEKIFPRVREFVPDAELHVYYGLDNIEKLLKQGDEKEQERAKKFFGNALETVEIAKNTPGVTWHGRVNQRDLTREWLKAGVWVYPNTYPESSCATCMEAQALGAIPVAHPLWGVGENVQWGTLIQSENPQTDPLTIARYVAEVVRLMTATGLDDYRQQMMADARLRFSWDNFVAQWEAWADPTRLTRMAFQRQHVAGRILNIGANLDIAALRRDFGAVNVDLHAVDPTTGLTNAVDQIADARALPFEDDSFDVAVLADILEHMSDSDAVQALCEAKRVASRVIVTVPEDHRSMDGQTRGPQSIDYAPGIPSWHAYPVSRSRVEQWFTAAGLTVDAYAALSDVDNAGHGFICMPMAVEAVAC